MQTQKSYVGFIQGAYRALLVDCARHYPELTKEFDRDFLRLSSAIDSHGIRFFLETMPSFRKHLDMCLSKRRLTPSNLLHFGVGKKGEVIPRLFRGLTSRVFDRNGMLKDRPDNVAVRLLRQLLGVCRKLIMDAGIRDRGNTVREFYRVDQSLKRGHLNWDDHITFDQEVETNATSFIDATVVNRPKVDDLLEGRTLSPSPDLYRVLVKVQQVADLITGMLGEFVPSDWVFKHGPGAVAGLPSGEYKYAFRRWPDRLESVFPAADFAHANYSVVEADSIEKLRSSGYYHQIPAKLCAVPKTIKTPRLIACEPVELQWCQQAVRDFFYDRVKGTVVSNFVDFHHQEKNGSLALSASLSRSHATIDLSSASDYISCWHVERLFRRSASLLRSLQASRSVWIAQDLCKYSPRYHYLRKYSTMGNATTFPVQSLLFTAVALGALCEERGLKVSLATLRGLGEREVRVFGDDIIVPADCSGLVVDTLQALGMRVNASKTFLEGNFRESCGVDGFGGDDVTTVNVLRVPSRTAPSSIVSTVDAHNNLLSAGYCSLATYIRKAATFKEFARIREVKHGTGAFGWFTYGVPVREGFSFRVNKGLHRLEVKCLGQRTKVARRPAEGHPGLLQFFTEAAKVVTSASSTLGYSGQRPKSQLALGWVQV
jgi:hypothetical protein